MNRLYRYLSDTYANSPTRFWFALSMLCVAVMAFGFIVRSAF